MDSEAVRCSARLKPEVESIDKDQTDERIKKSSRLNRINAKSSHLSLSLTHTHTPVPKLLVLSSCADYDFLVQPPKNKQIKCFDILANL